MPDLDAYAGQSAYSDPGRHAALLDDLPADVRELAAVVRNVVVHYRASGIDFPPERLTEIDSRWVERILDADQSRHRAPLATPREEPARVPGCCRDHTLLTVSALRHRGVPARSRVGFSHYFMPDFRVDHVIVEWWDGARWVWVDSELSAGPQWPFDPADMPRTVGAAPGSAPVFETAAQAWSAYRRRDTDLRSYGVHPDVPFGGPWFVRNYVLHELAHRRGDELLLWDVWGAMGVDLVGDLDLIDDVAALLLAADDGSEVAERELGERYTTDPRLHPSGVITSDSPSGRVTRVDLRARTEVPMDDARSEHDLATVAEQRRAG
jgi:transglutaminase superfamily protein